MRDGRRPHRFPKNVPSDTIVIGWKCQACGEWISEYRDHDMPCPVDWRRQPMPEARQFS